MQAADFEELLRPLFAGRRVVLAGGNVMAHAPTAALVRHLGATDVLIVATNGTGIGALPGSDVATYVAVDHDAASMSASIHAGNETLRHPPAEILDALARFDPDRQALVVGDFLTEVAELDGRPMLAYRRPQWVALEDKTLVDALWDRARLPRAPAEIVPLERAAVMQAAKGLDQGSGTVWTADASHGFHGGGEMTRWIRTSADIDETLAEFAGATRTLRVMSFLDGIPCSIHGIVYSDHVVAIRPVEMITLRRAGSPTFFYAGCASFYDPPDDTRAEMRAAARKVGALLRDEVDYRGAFTIDGVATASGFWPTELNPRMGAGLNVMLRALPELPLQLLLDALVGGVQLPYDPRQLEDLLVSQTDAHRFGGTWRPLPADVPAYTDRSIAKGPSGWRWANDTDEIVGHVTSGSRSGNGFVRFLPTPGTTPVGPSFAPTAIAFWAFADRELGTEIGPLEPAR